MIDAPRLLRDLQGDLGPLVADLGAKVKTDEDVRARLDREWRSAFDAHRTGRSFEDWLEDRLTQVAVAWLLACVFVRFCEDNLLIDEATIAGPGDRGDAARAAQQRYFTEHPHDSDREYLHSVFRIAAELPSLGGLLANGESPLWLVDPPADTCTRLLARFRATDDVGNLVHDFTDPAWSTRFLGDLYQDLSQYAKDNYALLQTPDFVEEFILDRTLTPAIETFGLARTTLIDPTCGSGHFLLGAFERLFQAWRDAEPGVDARVLAQRALTQVTGVDLNPFATAIARFRLLVAALKASQTERLADAPDFAIDVAVGDSLLWGARPGQFVGMEAAVTAATRQFLYRTEHADMLRRIFDRRYAAVVGNPPYIIARDTALNAQYRARYPDACHGKYSLAAPFMQFIFEMATTAESLGRPAGFIGMITANSFMKREFGKSLIEKVVPTWDVTHVIDLGSLRLDGHTTPTVIIFGRRRAPVAVDLTVVGSIRGEQPQPDDLGTGLVWRSILDMVDRPPAGNEFISVSRTERSRLARHPWSIGGGGAADLKDRLDAIRATRLRDRVESIGITAVTGEDGLYILESEPVRSRLRVPEGPPLVQGDAVRDWASPPGVATIWPYDDTYGVVPPGGLAGAEVLLWAARSAISSRRRFGTPMLERGLTWWEWQELYSNKLTTPLSIVFAAVATHNHFALDRGGKIFKQSAPVVKLRRGATVHDHFDLLGLLNSSVACFWMHQVFNPKPNPGDALWQLRFDHDGTKLGEFPLPKSAPPARLVETLDALSTDLTRNLPSADADAAPTRVGLDAARAVSEQIFASIVAAQEELDWTCLQLYGLTDEPLIVPDGEPAPPLQLGERAFEIVLARQVASGEVETAWSHGTSRSP